MLKRYQVLLPDWMGDNIKYYIDIYGLSFSEGIRAELCSAIIATVQLQFPEYKSDTTLEEIIDKLKKISKPRQPYVIKLRINICIHFSYK